MNRYLVLLVFSRLGALFAVGGIILALFPTALTLLFRGHITELYHRRFRATNQRRIGPLTVAIGSAVGGLVTLSSVGAGAIGGSALMLTCPELSAAQIVAADLAHSVPLTLIAGMRMERWDRLISRR